MTDGLIARIEQLIQQGQEAKNKDLRDISYGGGYITGESYELWISSCLLFLDRYYKNNPLYGKFTKAANKAPGNGTEHFDTMMGVLKALHSTPDLASETNTSIVAANYDKIFISHSSKDLVYVEQIIQLLNDIGIPKKSENIFCSSFEGYCIPLGEGIYEYLKGQFNQNIMVLFILSDNYYASVPCLNEMGATWITARDYHSILLPGFEYSSIVGAIDPTKICLRIDETQKLNSFKDKIIQKFNLTPLDGSIWENDRNKFVANIQQIALKNKPTDQQVRVEFIKGKPVADGKVEVEIRFINSSSIPVEISDLSFELVNEDGTVNSLQIIDSDPENTFSLYGIENRRELYKLNFNTNSFNIRKVTNANASFHYQTLY